MTKTLRLTATFVLAAYSSVLAAPAWAASPANMSEMIQTRLANYEKAREIGERKGMAAFLDALEPKLNKEDRKYFMGLYRGIVKFPAAKYVAPDTVELWYEGEDKGFPIQLVDVEKRLIRMDGKDVTVPRGSFEAMYTGILNHLVSQYGAGSKKKTAWYQFALIPEAHAGGAANWVRSWPTWGKALGIAGLAAGAGIFAWVALGSGDKDKDKNKGEGKGGGDPLAQYERAEKTQLTHEQKAAEAKAKKEKLLDEAIEKSKSDEEAAAAKRKQLEDAKAKVGSGT